MLVSYDFWFEIMFFFQDLVLSNVEYICDTRTENIDVPVQNWGYFQSQVGDRRSGRSTAQARTFHDFFMLNYPTFIFFGGRQTVQMYGNFWYNDPPCSFKRPTMWVEHPDFLSCFFSISVMFDVLYGIWASFVSKRSFCFHPSVWYARGQGGWTEMCQQKCLMARWIWFSCRVRWLLSNHEFWPIFLDFGKWTRSLVLIL